MTKNTCEGSCTSSNEQPYVITIRKQLLETENGRWLENLSDDKEVFSPRKGITFHVEQHKQNTECD
jgi:hypothetical protein